MRNCYLTGIGSWITQNKSRWGGGRRSRVREKKEEETEEEEELEEETDTKQKAGVCEGT